MAKVEDLKKSLKAKEEKAGIEKLEEDIDEDIRDIEAQQNAEDLEVWKKENL